MIENFTKKMLELPPDEIQKFKNKIETLRNDIPELEKFDYKQQFNAISVQSFDKLKELCTETERKVVDHKAIVNKFQTMTKTFGIIIKYPQLLDMNKAKNLAESSLKSVSIFKIFEKNEIFREQNKSFIVHS